MLPQRAKKEREKECAFCELEVSVMYVFMYVCFIFPDIKCLFEASKISEVELQLRSINRKTGRGFFNPVITIIRNFYTYANPFFLCDGGWGVVIASWNKIDYFAILKLCYLNTLLSSSYIILIKSFNYLCAGPLN